MRMPVLLLGAAAVAALGVAGLLRGAVPLSSAESASSTASHSAHDDSMAGMDGMEGMDMGSATATASAAGSAPTGASAGIGGPMEVTKAYVQEPASPDVAAAYFTVTNNSGQDDRLVEVVSGAGESTTIHDASMAPLPNGLALPKGKSVSFSVGTGHVMIQGLYGPIQPGQTVNLVLRFEKAPQLTVAAPVIAIGAPVPN